MKYFSLEAYVNLKQYAEKWVSVFVLVGCVLITGFLVMAAFNAEVLGSRLTSQTSYSFDSESF